MFGGVHLDWGTVGNVDSNDVPGTRTRFDASLAYTRHPNNIRMRNIKIGVMSRPFTTPGTGSGMACRFVGRSQHRAVENVFVESVTETGFFHTAGDLGYELLLITASSRLHTQDIRVSNFEVFNANKGRGAYIDCFADNIAAAVSGSGYVPLLDCQFATDQHGCRATDHEGAEQHRIRRWRVLRVVQHSRVNAAQLRGSTASQWHLD
jgi:hypothetical protein